MKRIISNEYVKIIECMKCHCMFTYENEDVHIKEIDIYPFNYKEVDCPKCGDGNVVGLKLT